MARHDDIVVERRKLTALEWVTVVAAIVAVLNTLVLGWAVWSIKQVADDSARSAVAVHDTNAAAHAVTSAGLSKHMATEEGMALERARMASDITELRKEVKELSAVIQEIRGRLAGQRAARVAGQ